MMQYSVAAIEGDGGRISSRVGGRFNSFEPFDPELAMAVPDAYDGAPPLSIDRRVLNKLGNHIVPNTDTSRPAVPNLFLEGKSRMGRADVAKRQAAHVGAIGARAMASLQSYPDSPQYDNNAYSFTSTYHDGTLKMFTMHATAPNAPDGRPQYHMTQLRTFAMADTSNTFREGATHYYRNARDLAKEQRDSFIQHANHMAQQTPTSELSRHSRTTTNKASAVRTDRQSHEYASSLGTDADTSTNKLALDQPMKRSRLAREDDDQDQMSFTRDLTTPTTSHTRQDSNTTSPEDLRRSLTADDNPSRMSSTSLEMHRPSHGGPASRSRERLSRKAAPRSRPMMARISEFECLRRQTNYLLHAPDRPPKGSVSVFRKAQAKGARHEEL